MRLLSTSCALLAASGIALAAPVTAHADTGGPRLYYVGLPKMWTAPAAHPSHRSAVPRPHAIDAPVYPEQVVPSPDGSRLAISTHVRRNSGQRIYVTGPRGQHPVEVARFVSDPETEPNYIIDGLSWRGEHRLYFSLSHPTSAGIDTAIDTVRVPAHGKAGPVREVPNSTGLYGLTVDPTGDRLAAVVSNPGVCDGTGSGNSADIVVLNLRTDRRRHLVTLTSPDASACPAPGALHWSPDGTRIAFAGLAFTRHGPKILMRVVETIATGMHQSHKPRVVSPYRRKLSASSPVWQSDHSLWFQARNDLYSIRFHHGTVAQPHRLTDNPSALKFNLSFG
jgi:hypothetical protein